MAYAAIAYLLAGVLMLEVGIRLGSFRDGACPAAVYITGTLVVLFWPLFFVPWKKVTR